MIAFKDEKELIAEIISDLIDPEFGTNWNLVIPPGVGDELLLEKFLQTLENEHSSVPIAVLAPDSVPSGEGYVRALHRQWSNSLELPSLSETPRPDELFDELMSLMPTNQPVIQVIKRFHKVVDLMEVWVLGKMRDAEREKKFKTFTCTPVSIEELKARWEDDHILSTSDYGQNLTSRDASLQELDEVLANTEGQLPPHLVAYAFEISGGYPAVFTNVVAKWKKLGCPQLTPSTRAQLKQVAVASLSRFIQWLDAGTSTRYRDSVIDLHQGFDAESARMILQYHPWKSFLLNGDSLRSESVGDAAVCTAIVGKVRNGTPEHVAAECEQRAKTFYLRSKFVNASMAMEDLQQLASLRPDLRMFLSCSKVMASLFHDSVASEDTDWRSVLRECNQACETLKTCVDYINEADFLNDRLHQLKSVAGDFSKANSNDDGRLVDVLCGLRPGAAQNPRGALLLLTAKYESSSAIAGNASALQSALPLPEQLFRVLVYWSLGINYYAAPSGMEESWSEACKNWPKTKGELVPTPAGTQFTSLVAFAYFACAEWRRRNLSVELSDFKKTESIFTKLEDLRNPKAHSYVQSNSKSRKWFFDTAKDWLEQATDFCPETCSREDLMGIVDPLPIPTQKS